MGIFLNIVEIYKAGNIKLGTINNIENTSDGYNTTTNMEIHREIVVPKLETRISTFSDHLMIPAKKAPRPIPRTAQPTTIIAEK